MRLAPSDTRTRFRTPAGLLPCLALALLLLVPSTGFAAAAATATAPNAPANAAVDAPRDRPALHEAVAAGDVEEVLALIAAGADLEAVDGSGSPALFVRPPCDDPAVVEILLAAGADVDHRNDLGHTPLWSAALLGHTWTVRVLLDAGADPDPRPDDGWTPLVVALLRGHGGTAAVLSDAGADPDVLLDDGRPLLEELAARGDAAGVGFVLERGSGEGKDAALRTAAALRHPEAVAVLLEHGADPEAPDRGGWTPLLLAARSGDAEVVDLLLAAGVPVDGLGGEGSRSTPLLVAAITGRETAALALLAAGADPDARNASGATALMFAAHHGMQDLVAELLARGADPAVTHLDGKTALAFALTAKKAGAVRALLEGTAASEAGEAGASAHGGSAEAGRELRLAGIGRVTPLALAAGGGDPELVRLLLRHGADPQAPSDLAGFGRATPLMLATTAGHAPVVELLLAHGADPATELDGRTAFDLAREVEAEETRSEVTAWLTHYCPPSREDGGGQGGGESYNG